MNLRILIVFLVLIGFNRTYAQTVNGIAFDKLEGNFVRIVATFDESDIYLDFGTRTNAPRYNNRLAALEERNIIKDKDGHERIFSSVIDALNFLTAHGYEFVQAYGVHEKVHSTHYYILKRKTS